MITRVLFVCLGNICRSPVAEGVFRALAPDIPCDSAGTGGWHIGEPPYAPMQAAAHARGYTLAGLRARQFKADDFDRFDLIIAMESANLRDIEALRPGGNFTPVRLFTQYMPNTDLSDVPDPYYTRDFDLALDLIEAAAKGLSAAL